ncbi:MAG: hypothetical protein RLZZ608_175 [Actinomycetota bacterium]|jgi:transcriptional regulator with XRE-family HTH domain
MASAVQSGCASTVGRRRERKALLVQLDVGTELRRVRESQKLSLRSVAGAVGVSASLLSQVETGKTQPSVGTLFALVHHLGMSLDGLMAPSTRDSVLAARGTMRSRDNAPHRPTGQPARSVVQRREDNPKIELQNGVRWERLAAHDATKVDPLIVTYAPGASSSADGKMMRHESVEYGVVLEGQFTLRVDFDTYTLEPGDSFCFDGTRPHLFSNHGDVPARGVWFVLERRDLSYEVVHDHDSERNQVARQ